MKGSLVIVGFFVLGILVGLTGRVPESLVEGNLTFYALCALLFCVGIGFVLELSIPFIVTFWCTF